MPATWPPASSAACGPRVLEAAQIRASDPGAETRAKVSAAHGIEVFADNAASHRRCRRRRSGGQAAGHESRVPSAGPSLQPQSTGGLHRRRHHLRQHDRTGSATSRSCAACPTPRRCLRQGVSGLYATAAGQHEQRQQAEELLSAVGLALWLDEEQQMDAVTAVSGSGPAYFFLLIEAMTAAGEKLGLPSETAAN